MLIFLIVIFHVLKIYAYDNDLNDMLMISGKKKMAMSKEALPSYEMEEGEIDCHLSGDESEKTILNEIKNLRKEMEEKEDMESSLRMEHWSGNGDELKAQQSSLQMGDVTFDEDGFKALWFAVICQERKIDQLESALNAINRGDGKGTPKITRDEMLQCMKNCIDEKGSDYGVSKQLLRKVVSEKFGIDIRSTNYLQKKFNAVLKYGIDTRSIMYDSRDQMFHNM